MTEFRKEDPAIYRKMYSISTGIDGLDEMLDGGILRGQITVVKAPTGGGKTTTALQFAHSCIQQGLSCSFISSNMEEDYLIQMGKNFGWNFEDYINQGLLNFEVKPPITTEVEPLQRPMKGGSAINSKFKVEVISERIENLIQYIANLETNVVIIDSLSEFLLLTDSKLERRGYVLHLYNAIKERNATALINIEEEVPSEEAEIFADGIIRFYRTQAKKTLRSVASVIKMRLKNHSKEVREYRITSEGIKIYSKHGVV